MPRQAPGDAGGAGAVAGGGGDVGSVLPVNRSLPVPVQRQPRHRFAEAQTEERDRVADLWLFFNTGPLRGSPDARRGVEAQHDLAVRRFQIGETEGMCVAVRDLALPDEEKSRVAVDGVPGGAIR